MFIKKFESFDDDNMYNQIDYYDADNFELFNSGKNLEPISEKELMQIKNYFSQNCLMGWQLRTTNLGYCISISVGNAIISILKKDDDWWFIKIYFTLSSRASGYKCDTLEGFWCLMDDIFEIKKGN